MAIIFTTREISFGIIGDFNFNSKNSEEICLNVQEVNSSQVMTAIPKINVLYGCFGLMKQSVESICEAMKPENDNGLVSTLLGTKTFKKLVLLNEKILSMISTNEEAALIPRCLTALTIGR
jgi:hypothetical protein